MNRSDLHTAWARLFVASLAGAGVRDVVLSPGSRSTPLALAIAGEPRLRVTVAIDERSAGFVALGIGRSTGRPAALVCTSGTAGAHYLPAVIEASEAEVPMVAVTADRPWELQRCGASQTIDQRRLFGAFVRHDAVLGEPSPEPAALRAVPRVAAFAVARSLGPIPGPVHVDVAFRKPLEPIAAGQEPWSDEVARLLSAGPAAVRTARPRASDEAVAELCALVVASRSTLLVAGPARPAERGRLGEAVAAFARAARAPVVGEVASGIRFGSIGVDVAASPDELLASEALRARLATDLMIEIGAPPVASGWGRCAQRAEVARVVVGAAGLADPHGTARLVIEGDAPDLLQRAAARLSEVDDDASAARARATAIFAAASRAASSTVMRALAAGPWSEGAIARALIDALPAGTTLLIGNSGTVRELDAWAGAGGRALEVLHQRGAAGIDGLIAGAVGARVVVDPGQPVAVILGDVAALHDLGSLVLARSVTAPLVMVVVHNDGGRIFEQLPLGERSELASELERLFITPHGLSLARAAEGLGVAAARVTDPAAFRAALGEALATPRATLIEAVVPPRDAGPRRRALALAMEKAIAEAVA